VGTLLVALKKTIEILDFYEKTCKFSPREKSFEAVHRHFGVVLVQRHARHFDQA
jgi:hypothetical protein